MTGGAVLGCSATSGTALVALLATLSGPEAACEASFMPMLDEKHASYGLSGMDFKLISVGLA